MTTLTSRNGALQLGPNEPIVLISDQLRVKPQESGAVEPTGELLARMVRLAQSGAAAGMDVFDIMTSYPGVDELTLLPAIATAVHEAVGCPLSLDSRDPEALHTALAALRPYKVLINSVTAEATVLDALLPIAAEFDAAIVGMPIGDTHGLPKDVEGRLAEAAVILDRAAALGIPRDDVLMDGICLASSAEPGSMAVTLETLRSYHDDLGVATILGISNAGHGMPTPSHIALAYLVAAVPWGLDAALVSPRIPHLIEEVRAIDFLTARDPYGKRYLRHYRSTHHRTTGRA
jgi:5-methyltetrahydrofolate--homocysteine methyltransferase